MAPWSSPSSGWNVDGWSRIAAGGGGGGGGLIVDQLTSVTPVALFSTRKLLTAYAGNAMNVTGSGGGFTGNVGFSGSDLNTSVLTGGTSVVNTWYDQSGNGNNATQFTAVSDPPSPYPILVLSGTTQTLGGTHAALNTSSPNTNAALTFSTSITTPSSVSIAWCFKCNVGIVASTAFTDGNPSNWRYLLGIDASATMYALYNFVSSNSGGTPDLTAVHTAVATFDNAGTALGNLYIDNALVIGPVAINASSFLDGQVIFASNIGGGVDMNCGEMLFFTGIMSPTDRATYHSGATVGCQTYWGSN